MNANTLVILVCLLSLIFGVLIGVQFFKIYNRKKDGDILKNAKEVLDGTRDNSITVDGEKLDATLFRLRKDDGEEIVIDLKGGGAIQDGRRKEDPKGAEGIQEQETETFREISGCGGEEKRFTRTRSIISRIRRFG